MSEMYITDKYENYIIDIDEANKYSLDEIKNVTSLDPLRVLNIRW